MIHFKMHFESMMIYRPFLTVLMILAGAALATPAAASSTGNWCKADNAPRIEIKTSTDQVSWDFTQSEKQLNRFKIDTVNPYGKEVITDVGGLMQGGIELKESMRFKTLTHNGLNQICYWFDTIVVTLHIKPTIYIATEFPRGSCKHEAIREHELKHIAVDREIVNKYANMLGQAVRDEMMRQTVFGPYNVSQSGQAEAYIRGRLERLLKTYSRLMDDERRTRQQKVDSLSEYERVNRMCR